MGWDSNNFIGKVKPAHTQAKQVKEFILHFLWAGKGSAKEVEPCKNSMEDLCVLTL